MFRVGHDKSNEHVHNYLVNIFGRGGLLQLTLFILIHLTMYLIYYRKYKKGHLPSRDILKYIC